MEAENEVDGNGILPINDLFREFSIRRWWMLTTNPEYLSSMASRRGLWGKFWLLWGILFIIQCVVKHLVDIPYTGLMDVLGTSVVEFTFLIPLFLALQLPRKTIAPDMVIAAILGAQQILINLLLLSGDVTPLSPNFLLVVVACFLTGMHSSAIVLYSLSYNLVFDILSDDMLKVGLRNILSNVLLDLLPTSIMLLGGGAVLEYLTVSLVQDMRVHREVSSASGSFGELRGASGELRGASGSFGDQDFLGKILRKL